MFDPNFEQSEDLKIVQRRRVFSRDPHKATGMPQGMNISEEVSLGSGGDRVFHISSIVTLVDPTEEKRCIWLGPVHQAATKPHAIGVRRSLVSGICSRILSKTSGGRVTDTFRFAP